MEKKQKRPKEYIGITEAAEILSVSYASVRDNVVPNAAHFKVGRRTLI